jgi:hypothetical protein
VRALRSLLWLTALTLVLAGVLVPVVWLSTASTLPDATESEQQLETHLRQSIESERQGQQLGLDVKQRRKVKWARPEIVDYPKRLVALFITETGCPTYFQTPREDGLPWLARIARKTIDGRDLDGDGACELNYARMLARRLGAKTPLQLAVASDRLHRFLQRDQLVAYNLASVRFAPGLVGVADASFELMQQELPELDDAALAELQLAIPPWDFWDDVRQCRNAPLLREARDTLLTRLSQQGLISEEMAKSAATQPLRCLSVRR